MRKTIKNTMKKARKNPLMTLAIVGGGLYLYNRAGMPALLPSASAEAVKPTAPVSTYSYDSYAPIRNEPYYSHMHMFGNTDSLDPNFYGF